MFTFVITIWTFLPLLIGIDTAGFQIPCLLPTSILIALTTVVIHLGCPFDSFSTPTEEAYWFSGLQFRWKTRIILSLCIYICVCVCVCVVSYCLDSFCLCHRRSDLSTSLHHRGYCMIALVYPISKVRGTNMDPIWSRQDPGGPHVGPINFAIWVCNIGQYQTTTIRTKRESCTLERVQTASMGNGNTTHLNNLKDIRDMKIRHSKILSNSIWYLPFATKPTILLLRNLMSHS